MVGERDNRRLIAAHWPW